MTRQSCGLGTASRTPHAPGCHTSHQHHGLGIGRQGQHFLGAFVDQTGHILAQGLRGLLQRLLHSRMVAPGVEHAHSLRALPRKNKCE